MQSSQNISVFISLFVYLSVNNFHKPVRKYTFFVIEGIPRRVQCYKIRSVVKIGLMTVMLDLESRRVARFRVQGRAAAQFTCFYSWLLNLVSYVVSYVDTNWKVRHHQSQILITLFWHSRTTDTKCIRNILRIRTTLNFIRNTLE